MSVHDEAYMAMQQEMQDRAERDHNEYMDAIAEFRAKNPYQAPTQPTSMKTAQSKVAEFMHAAQQDVPLKPTMPDQETRILRAKLMLEECMETIKLGLGVIPSAVTKDDKFEGFNFHIAGPGNLLEVADGIGDQLVVVLGTAVACGLDAEGIFNEVHHSNMTKFLAGGYRRDDGKWIKSPLYSPADLGPFIT